MDYKSLKSAVEKVEMPDDMRARIIRNCELKAKSEKEENAMNKANRRFGKPAVAAAVLALCLCLTGVAAAAGSSGFFKDIKNWAGTVVGAEYEQASDEITAAAYRVGDGIAVRAVVADPAALPYSEMETLGIGSYKIVDMSGNVVAKGESTEPAELSGGEAEITVPLDNIGSGEYKMVIASFVGAKKADQPLQINGTWECPFSL